eukprot:s1043_g8.t1
MHNSIQGKFEFIVSPCTVEYKASRSEVSLGELREGCTIDLFKDWSPAFQVEINQKGLDLRRAPFVDPKISNSLFGLPVSLLVRHCCQDQLQDRATPGYTAGHKLQEKKI